MDIETRIELFRKHVKGKEEPDMSIFAQDIQNHLPSVISENEWTEQGFVESKHGLLVPAYVASGLGFNFPGRYFLNEYLYPKLREIKVLPLCPFKACGEHFARVYATFLKEKDQKVGDHYDALDLFNRELGIINYHVLMPRSKLLIAVLDAGTDVDSGVAAEIADFSHKFKHPVVMIRSDLRPAENVATGTNPAVRFFGDYGEYHKLNAYIERDLEQAYIDGLEIVDKKVAEIRSAV